MSTAAWKVAGLSPARAAELIELRRLWMSGDLVGRAVRVIGIADSERTVTALYTGERTLGGVRLDRAVAAFQSWNIDSLELVADQGGEGEPDGATV